MTIVLRVPYGARVTKDSAARPFHIDEGRRATPQEWWYLDATSDDGLVRITTEVLIDNDAHRGRFWFIVAIAGSPHGSGAAPDRVVAVVENDVPVPPTSLEVRTSGLWFEYRCQRHGEHFTVDLEAFGLEIEPGTRIDENSYGLRTPVGCELEWITTDSASLIELESDGYGLANRVEGVVLVGPDEFTMIGSGHRYHRWGTTPIDDTESVHDGEVTRPVATLVTSDGAVGMGIDAKDRWRRQRVEPETLR